MRENLCDTIGSYLVHIALLDISDSNLDKIFIKNIYKYFYWIKISYFWYICILYKISNFVRKLTYYQRSYINDGKTFLQNTVGDGFDIAWLPIIINYWSGHSSHEELCEAAAFTIHMWTSGVRIVTAWMADILSLSRFLPKYVRSRRLALFGISVTVHTLPCCAALLFKFIMFNVS